MKNRQEKSEFYPKGIPLGQEVKSTRVLLPASHPHSGAGGRPTGEQAGRKNKRNAFIQTLKTEVTRFILNAIQKK